MREHEIAKIVTELTKLSKEFGQTQQLRERIAHYLVPLLKDATKSPNP